MSNSQPDAHIKRRAEVSVSDISAKAKALGELATQLKACADQAKAANVQTFVVDGVMKFDRATGLLAEFVANVTQAVVRSKFK